MKRFIIALLACTLIFGYCDVQAQTKKKSSSKSSKSSKDKKSKNKKGKKGADEPTLQLTQLPYNSGDCIFAIPINVDQTYGPTTAPQGAGRIMEVMADKRHPNLPEFEHNVVWYKFTVPYNGKLDIAVTQLNLADDYDMVVYRYTDVYFSNHIQSNKVLPVAVNLSSIDSSLLQKPKRTAPAATGDAKADLKAKQEAAKLQREAAAKQAAMGTIGMYHEATDILLTKASTKRHIRSIDVRKGEVYYIMLDNVTPNGQGHSIKVSIHVDAFEVPVSFYDPKIKKNVDVSLTILEKNTNNRVIARNDKFRGGRIKFVPGFNYTLYAKRDGYFSIFYDFNSDRFKQDTLLRMKLYRCERGTVYPISDIYFEDEYVLMHESDSTLMNYVQMFKNHPDVHFTIKGFVQTYGVDPEHDQLVTLERAKAVKEFFVKNGIPEDNIKAAGMTPTDIKRAATAAFDNTNSNKKTKTSGDQEFVKVQLIITNVGAKVNP
ncbi:MAG: OmpA family protein [Bacteroidales bacterium]|nr:OmpA family protein [Bacteroidales bacterium]